MHQLPWNDAWTVRTDGQDAADAVPVDLPHDAMIALGRAADARTGGHGGYFPGSRVVYARAFEAPSDAGAADRWSLLFEGVYGHTVVRLDGTEIGRNVSPYREFEVALPAVEPGGRHLIEVDVDNTEVPNSRWYTGTGIYRPVHLVRRGPVAFAADGIRVRTSSIAPSAVVDIDVFVDGALPAGARIDVQLRDSDGVVAAVEATATGPRTSVSLRVDNPRLWSDEEPHLYDLSVRLDADDLVLDRYERRIGIRSIEVDPRRGLRINGRPTLLRGACVHHDSGVLGAATFRAAEFRRATLLKNAGFNAVRSSHNPLSRAFVDACDELGLYVLDETTDHWTQRKTPGDLAPRYEELWRDDARAMIRKDRNAPSVIMYSIGNEIVETATPAGVTLAGEISAFVRALDPTRPDTVAINLMLNVLASRGRSVFTTESADHAEPAPTSTAANLVADRIGGMMQLIAKLPLADKSSRGAFAEVDVAGYNYAWSRYRGDAKKYPDRVILGTESMPHDLPRIWGLVQELPAVIGDFMWTGWDYLGESGIGVWTYGKAPQGISKPFPYLMAGCGAFDITGLAGAPALLAGAVWDRLPAPAIAVRPVHRSAERTNRVAWRGSDAESSWSWRGAEGARARVEVYSADDEVELFQNGRSLGRRRAGRAAGFVARFTTVYDTGTLEAVGYRGGQETARSILRSATGPLSLQLRSETTHLRADGQDLAYVWVELADANGTVDSLVRDRVTLEVDGPGRLAGFGTAEPAPMESFTSSSHWTYRGRALAVIRAAASAGTVRVRAISASHGEATVTLDVSAW